MTVSRAHGLYMVAAREGRASRAKRPNKLRTISDKLQIYRCDIAPKLAKRSIYEVAEKDLIRLVEAKGKTAKVRANRLAAELKVFFGWAASLRGLEVGLETDPSRRLGDLRFPETPRSRKLSLLELEWFLKALVEEERWAQRGMLLCLLTAARLSEVSRARTAECVNGLLDDPERTIEEFGSPQYCARALGVLAVRKRSRMALSRAKGRGADQQYALVQSEGSGSRPNGCHRRSSDRTVHSPRFSADGAQQHQAAEGRFRDRRSDDESSAVRHGADLRQL
jgi:hypothetical protein